MPATGDAIIGIACLVGAILCACAAITLSVGRWRMKSPE